MKGLYIYLLFSTACAYKLEYDFFKLNKKVNNIDRLFFKSFWWITRQYGKCPINITGLLLHIKYHNDIHFNPITIFILPLIPGYNIILIAVLMKILCSGIKSE